MDEACLPEVSGCWERAAAVLDDNGTLTKVSSNPSVPWGLGTFSVPIAVCSIASVTVVDFRRASRTWCWRSWWWSSRSSPCVACCSLFMLVGFALDLEISRDRS